MRVGWSQEKGENLRELADFLGQYDVSRVIEDARAGAVSRFEGTAEISRDGTGAAYGESGAMMIGGQRFLAERRYLWRANSARIDVLFEDGRAFHDFDPEAGGLASAHLCGEDMYRGGYDFTDWPRWSVTWDVQGPRKAYKSVTWYERSAAFALAE